MAGEEELSGDYLQLRKDLMKVPKQFYLNKDHIGGIDGEHHNRVGDYFKYMNGEDEAALKLGKDKKSSELLAKSGGLQARAPQTTAGGHPLVPKLNLPQPD